MKYEKVKIGEELFYRVVYSDVNGGRDHVCFGCHFYSEPEHCLFPPEVFSTNCVGGLDEPMFIFMTESELAKENIRKRKEKNRSSDI